MKEREREIGDEHERDSKKEMCCSVMKVGGENLFVGEVAVAEWWSSIYEALMSCNQFPSTHLAGEAAMTIYWGHSSNTGTIPVDVRWPEKSYTVTTHCSSTNHVGMSGSDNELAWLHVHMRFIALVGSIC